MKALFLIFLFVSLSLKASDSRPNIVWFFIEDTNDWMGCYGDDTVPTPNIDKFAARGIRFDRAYMPAGVCSATRSALAFGCMQTSLGIHNHRSSRKHIPEEVIRLPKQYKTVYEMMRQSGYYVVNNGPKNDFNFEWPTQSKSQMKRAQGPYGTGAYFEKDRSKLFYDVSSEKWNDFRPLWKDKPKDQPLFIQFQLKGGKNSGAYKGVKAFDKFSKETHTDQSKIRVMPYYPDIPEVRKEIAHHYDTIRQLDDEVGLLVDMLKKDGLYDNTVFFLFSDHGMKLYRHKQWLYEGGIKVPFIMWGKGIEQGKVRKDLVSGIDITATTLALSNIKQPEWMEGENLLSQSYKRDFVISARDRCDYTIERVRAVTTRKFKHIRNFLIDRPFMQPQYRDKTAFVQDSRKYFEAGKMNKTQAFLWQSKRTPEELYDLENDPHEIRNLVNDPSYKDVLQEHQKILADWIKETDDKGQYPEPIDSLKGVLIQYSKEAVNPEYEKAR